MNWPEILGIIALSVIVIYVGSFLYGLAEDLIPERIFNRIWTILGMLLVGACIFVMWILPVILFVYSIIKELWRKP